MRAQDRAAGVLSLLAGLVHGGLGPEHFREWWGYGLFFAFAAAAQAILGLALLVNPLDPAHPRAPALRRALLLGGIVGNLLLVATYALTRTVGIPIGPGAGEAEPVGALDLATQVAEVATMLLLASSLAGPRPRAQPSKH